jgi:hypothetical protein
LLTLLFGSSSSSLAASPSAATSTYFITNCGSSAQNLITNDTQLGSVPPGTIYVKIPYRTNTQPVSIYFQAFSNNNCASLGTENVSYGLWTKIGSLNQEQIGNFGGTFIAQSTNISAAPYQAALDILIVQNPNTCNPTLACNISYDGYTGYIQPSLISEATDQIAVFLVSPYQNEKVTGIAYYDKDVYLYSTKKLEPFNKDYLSGGLHNVSIVISLANGQKLNLSKNINMGPDYARVDFIRSILYRSSGTTRILFYITAGLILLYILLAVARLIYKKHFYTVEHGLDKDIAPPEDNNPEDQIHVG